MKRSVTLIGAWLALACLLCWSGRGRADFLEEGPVAPPICLFCDCAEDIAWGATGDTKSYVITVYDAANKDKIGDAVTTARWKNEDGGKNKVYPTTACLDDNHATGDMHRVLIYNKSWSPKCKRTGTQTDDGYIATKYDKDETAYTYPIDADQKLKPRVRCSK